MSRAEARVGRVLRGKWRLDRLLGLGGFAAVYSATHRAGKRVAIKILHAELSADAQIRERFVREARVSNHVGHPGVVAVADDDVTEQGEAFLVMDLLEGETVESRRERSGGQLEVVDVLSITDQVLEVLAVAHAQGIVHRDLKPENLFVTRAGEVKILDFGIARLREGGTSATQSGLSMGTPAFMAQEQARALWNEVDARTDLWAVGATMFACLAGRVVHEGRTANEQLLAAMTKTAPAMRSLVPALPHAVGDVVDRALAFDREARFQSAREMQTGVRAAYESMQSAPISSAPRLAVPEIAVRKTLPSAVPSGRLEPGAADLRTDSPVAAGQTGRPINRATIGWRAALGVGACVVVVGAVLTTVLIVRAGSGPTTNHSTALPPAASSISAPSAAPAVSSAPAAVPPIASADPTPDVTAKDRHRARSSPAPAATPPSDAFAGGRHK